MKRICIATHIYMYYIGDCRNPTMDNSRPVKRIMSTISKHSEEAEDDEICSGNLWIINEHFGAKQSEKDLNALFSGVQSPIPTVVTLSVCTYIYVLQCVCARDYHCWFVRHISFFSSGYEFHTMKALFSWKNVVLSLWLVSERVGDAAALWNCMFLVLRSHQKSLC